MKTTTVPFERRVGTAASVPAGERQPAVARDFTQLQPRSVAQGGEGASVHVEGDLDAQRVSLVIAPDGGVSMTSPGAEAARALSPTELKGLVISLGWVRALDPAYAVAVERVGKAIGEPTHGYRPQGMRDGAGLTPSHLNPAPAEPFFNRGQVRGLGYEVSESLTAELHTIRGDVYAGNVAGAPLRPEEPWQQSVERAEANVARLETLANSPAGQLLITRLRRQDEKLAGMTREQVGDERAKGMELHEPTTRAAPTVHISLARPPSAWQVGRPDAWPDTSGDYRKAFNPTLVVSGSGFRWHTGAEGGYEKLAPLFGGARTIGLAELDVAHVEALVKRLAADS